VAVAYRRIRPPAPASERAGAWAETSSPRPYLVLLDTDTIFVGEPSFARADVGVRPVDECCQLIFSFFLFIEYFFCEAYIFFYLFSMLFFR
jgi:hypothetical protein